MFHVKPGDEWIPFIIRGALRRAGRGSARETVSTVPAAVPAIPRLWRRQSGGCLMRLADRAVRWASLDVHAWDAPLSAVPGAECRPRVPSGRCGVLSTE
ncbi:hypothetical protein GCM10027440_43070 [Nocardiopsis coralliicola]